MGNACVVKASMRSQDHPDSAGWMIRLKAHDPSFRATSRPERFGRISHVIKKEGVSVQLLQGVSSESKTEFRDLSAEQHQILNVLAEIGIVAKISR